uniref:WLM domain-containing protein n=1 Tax=viral metagenome TaxID=1070528 RepID=A0A6C0KU52_9ZZZZ
MKLFLFSLLFFLSIVFVLLTANRIYEKFVEDDPMLIDIRKTLEPVFPDINTVILLKGKKSYTINKKKIHLCLFDKDGKYYDKNMLIYVTLHELAHVRCDEVGHTDKFHTIFSDILDTAAKNGIYDPKKPIIKNYCEY